MNATDIDYDASTRTGRDALRSDIRMAWDGVDPWGSALSALGGVCDVLCDSGGDIPALAGYTPGMGGPALEDYPASEFVELRDDGAISIGDLEYWARVLDRFADLVPEDQQY